MKLPSMNRYAVFGVTILLGLAASLYYGWVARPVEVKGAAPDQLRIDFRADYALMVAEAFAADQDVERAIESLAFLDADNPLPPVLGASDFGGKNGYSDADLDLLTNLAAALNEYDPRFAGTATP